MSEQRDKKPIKRICAGLLAHVDAGKTTFSEQVLYRMGVLRRVGGVDSGDTFLDWNEIERERGITVFSEQAVFRNGEDTYYLIDTPGHADFSAEMERALEAMDYGILIISGTDGIQGHTETIWKLLERYGIPVFLFINKLDRDTADYNKVLKELKERFSPDICDMSFWGGEGRIPEEPVVYASEEREEILETYLSGNLTAEELAQALTVPVKMRRLFPCMGGSAAEGEGIGEFMKLFFDLTVSEFREEGPLQGRVYKIRRDPQGERLTFLKLTSGSLQVKETVGEEKIHQIRIYSGARYVAVQKACAGDLAAVTGISSLQAGDRIGVASERSQRHICPALRAKVLFDSSVSEKTMLSVFRQLEEEDPSLDVKWEEELGQLSVGILGRIQLEVLEDTVWRRFGYRISFGAPQVLYKETIAAPVYGYGHFEPLRHYAEAVIRMEPGPRGSGISFRSECHVDQLPANYQSQIRSHVFDRIHRGVLTGAELTDVEIVLTDGKFHIKHTEGGDFREALYRAVRQGLMKAESILLEPYYDFSFFVPEECIGRVMADISKYHGEFTPAEISAGTAVINGSGPVSEFMNYGEELAEFTGGRGTAGLRFSGYRPCHNQEEIIKEKGYCPDSDTEQPSYSVFCSKGAAVAVNWQEAEEKMHCLKK